MNIDYANRFQVEFLPGHCWCCTDRGEFMKEYNLLTCSSDNGNGNQTFAEMLRLSFAVDVLSSEMDDETDNYICDLCILRLTDAFNFKKEIVNARKRLLDKVEHAIEAVNNIYSLPETAVAADEFCAEYSDNFVDDDNDEKPTYRGYHSTEDAKEKQRNYSRKREEEELLTKICKETLTCLICQERFHNCHMLSLHLNDHYPYYICDKCEKAFASKKRVLAHVRNHVTGDYKCKFCNEIFDAKMKLASHAAKHRVSLRHCCTKCPERFKNFHERQKHLIAVHGVAKNCYKCSSCDATFELSSSRAAHVRRVHLKERNKICTVCAMAFFATEELSKHMTSHTGERRFTCDVCHNKYKRRYTLNEHMKIHANDRRYICNICSRSFVQKCVLRGHMKMHSNETSILKNIEKLDESGKTFLYMDIVDNNHLSLGF